MPRSAEGMIFLFSCGILGKSLYETIVSSKAVPEVLDMKYRSEFKHGLSSIGKWGGQLKTTKREIRDFII